MGVQVPAPEAAGGGEGRGLMRHGVLKQGCVADATVPAATPDGKLLPRPVAFVGHAPTLPASAMLHLHGLAYDHPQCAWHPMSLDRLTPADDPEAAEAGPDACGTLSADQMLVQATAAAGFLKALSHEGRLMILCHLSAGEKSVTELEHLLSSRQAAVSQQLARLRLEGLVSARREGQAIFYSILDPKVGETIALLARLFR